MDRKKIIAIAGLNGSGKTQYVEKMRRQMASDTVRYIAFCDSYGPATDRVYYLQLRWNQHDIDAETPTVGQALERSFLLSGPDTSERRSLQQQLYVQFGLMDLLDKYVILLSSGELRKFQLVKTLMARPQTLILDNPFIGLDAETRQQLRALLYRLIQSQQLTIYLVVSRCDDIPDYVDDIVWLTPESVMRAEAPRLGDADRQLLLHLPAAPDCRGSEVVQMTDVSIRYGSRTILSHLDWTVREGERWALSGQNGSGKSTLLSLISADNPQAYACNICLFGKQRGSGETIWQIKRRIGYVSPEMHRAYHHNLPVEQIVASGLKDTVGLFMRTNEAERETCHWWMRLFGLGGMEQRPFLSLSSGEQRLALLARAFVKDPALLILDEPLHGLDSYNRQRVKDIIDTFCQRPGKTLIMVTHYDEEFPECIDHRKTLVR
ncbi:MAG: ATP-binding cassette domain-containing protein [Prevotella sp.]|nr:ATP-binding cassette domain-containing protein [Prevotella sp.]